MSTRASTTVSVRVVREVFRARHARACDDGDKNENNVCILCVFHGFWWNGMVAVAVVCVLCFAFAARCLLGVRVRNVAEEGHPGSVFGVFPAHTRARIRGNESEQVATVEDDVEIFVRDVCALR